ncbi:hypothetical protein LIER_05007 [Lithospermum erythrorhizon]|uniref:Uncharacterized protein n=1 Tax=Lithospermum erythrorhizon TaxID=34254 RepID=A0AAV3P3H8_LITER
MLQEINRSASSSDESFLKVVALSRIVASLNVPSLKRRQKGSVTGKAADVIAAANTAAEVALRLVRPGKKEIQPTKTIDDPEIKGKKGDTTEEAVPSNGAPAQE